MATENILESQKTAAEVVQIMKPMIRNVYDLGYNLGKEGAVEGVAALLFEAAILTLCQKLNELQTAQQWS